MNKKILVAMSGGVDSSVAAALLKNQGHNVIGVFIFFQSQDIVQASYQSAKKVAEKINIKFYTLDLSQEFQKLIINDFIEQYRIGNTPNPCIRCNKYFKFGKLLDFAKKLNCNHIATGHYARIKNNKLITAKDKNKDQSYFLYELTQEKLKHILFPLNNLKKSRVKKLAKKFGLPVYNKKESSDVCFINTDMRNFLSTHIKTSPGNIIDTNNKIIGQHIGLPFYTIGQRQGINIGGTGPYYVIKKDFKNNTLIVTNNAQYPQLFSNKISIKNINWISGQEPKLPLKCLAQHRYQTEMFEVEIQKNGHLNSYLIKTKKPQRAITPGQSVVLYRPVRKFFGRSFEVLGGGVIV